jgi:alanine-glyoxylate transaminase/serine-glyoxylate transaminase/serine-pyruvate transaminase
MIPKGADDQTVRGKLLEEYGIEIGGGLGKFAGRAWRVGLMGYASQQSNVMLLLSALGDVLKNERVDEGLAAAASVYEDRVAR